MGPTGNPSARSVDPALAHLIRSLAARGWTRKEFSDNHLEHVARTVLEWSPEPLRSPFEPYWRTVATITSILQRAGIRHVVIKTRRSYPYSDTNVDVFITEEDAPNVQRLLCAAAWRMPSRAVVLKQRVIEREKLKLPPRQPGFVPAHLYMSVCWRYQRDVTFLAEGLVEEIPIAEEAPGLEAEFGALTTPVPTRAADILLHAAEIVFENYRITLGEVLYMSWLLRHVDAADQHRIQQQAADRGAAVATRCVLDRTRAVTGNDLGAVETDWPRNFTAAELLASWGERFGSQLRRRRPMAALEEWLGYAAFGSLYRIKRTWFG
jgi:hypothetical protein